MEAKNFKIKYLDAHHNVKETIITTLDIATARNEASRLGQVLEVKSTGGTGRWGKMSIADRMIFFQRLASMLSSKVGTSDALNIIYQSFNGVVRDAARLLRERVEKGASLPEAMEHAGERYFPDAVVAIVKTGSKGGDLAYAIREAARFEKELDAVKRESNKGIGSAMMGFIIGIATLIGSTWYVGPMMQESSLVQSAGDGIDVGWIMTLAHSITFIALLVAAIIGGILFYGVILRPFFPAAVDRGIMKIPFYRDMALAKTNYMVFFGLAVLLKAGLRVEEALQLSIDSAPKGELKNDLERALVTIRKGSAKPWPYAMTMLHPTDKAALATAQDRTQTAKTIHDLSLQYQSLYQSRLALFVPAMQAFSAIILSIAGFVLFGVSVVPMMQSMSGILKAM